jgi:phosphoribosyl 1,2-cyclic phosphodiesterase
MQKQTKLKFWGVRGSVAAAGQNTAKYGGNTSCVALTHGDTRIICDAGTGIRPLGNSLRRRIKKPLKATILLSHLHWDHFVGLPFFEPLYDRRNEFLIAGPGYKGESFKSLLYRVVAPPYFPITPSTFAAKVHYRTLSGEPFAIDDIVVEPFECNHPGGSLGWKFILPSGKKLVHVTDHEPKESHQKKMLEWMRGADFVIHDSQYSPSEYKKFEGWGHSPYGQVVRMAIEAEAKRLVMFHHDPESDDKTLEGRLHHAREMALSAGSNLHIDLAREGREYLL